MGACHVFDTTYQYQLRILVRPGGVLFNHAVVYADGRVIEVDMRHDPVVAIAVNWENEASPMRRRLCLMSLTVRLRDDREARYLQSSIHI